MASSADDWIARARITHLPYMTHTARRPGTKGGQIMRWVGRSARSRRQVAAWLVRYMNAFA